MLDIPSTLLNIVNRVFGSGTASDTVDPPASSDEQVDTAEVGEVSAVPSLVTPQSASIRPFSSFPIASAVGLIRSHILAIPPRVAESRVYSFLERRLNGRLNDIEEGRLLIGMSPYHQHQCTSDPSSLANFISRRVGAVLGAVQVQGDVERGRPAVRIRRAGALEDAIRAWLPSAMVVVSGTGLLAFILRRWFALHEGIE